MYIDKIKSYKFRLLTLCVVVILSACNASKSLTKKGDKLAEAGIHQEAVEYYIKALRHDRSRVTAQVGLRKSSKEVINTYQTKFFKEFNSEEYKQAVYTYIEIEKLKSRLNEFKVDVSVPGHLKADYETAKGKYLEESFAKANQLMVQENFTAAETIFNEIKSIEPSYKSGSLSKLLEISKLEPPYRAGNESLEAGKNRSAYFHFKEVVDLNASYKDAKFKMEEALELAQFPIAVLKFQENNSRRGVSDQIAANMLNDLLENKGPFIKVIDRTHMDKVLNEQYLAMNGWVEGQGAVKTGALLGAKAILSGKVLSVTVEGRNPTVHREKAYRRRSVKYYNQEKKRTETRYEYDKVYVNNYKGYNQVKISFQYMLVSAETGEILMSGIEEQAERSEVDFISANGDFRDYYPGVWNVRFQDSSTDKRFTNRSTVNAFQRKFKANQKLASTSSLQENAVKHVGNIVAQKLRDFNPEQ